MVPLNEAIIRYRTHTGRCIDTGRDIKQNGQIQEEILSRMDRYREREIPSRTDIYKKRY